LPCVDCTPGGGGFDNDFKQSVPLASTYVRNLGSRTYGFHYNSLRPSISARLFNSLGAVMGHVSFGARYIPNGWQHGYPQAFVSAHIIVPSSGVDMWIRYGRLVAGNGVPYPWVAVRPSGASKWSRYMTVAGFRQWMGQQTATVQNAIKAAAQAAEDTKKEEQANNPIGNSVRDLFNSDGTCTGATWLGLIGLGVGGCALVPSMPFLGVPVCYGALTAMGYCAGAAIGPPLYPIPPDESDPTKAPVPEVFQPSQPVTVTDPVNPQEPVPTQPSDPGGTGGPNGGGTDGGGVYTPEGDGGSTTAGGTGGMSGCP